MTKLYEDFINMQSELTSVAKNSTAQAGSFKFKYADLTQIVETIRPVMAQNGFGFIQKIETKDGVNYLTTMLVHKSGESIDSSIAIGFEGKDIKQFGAAITYYRRYALQSILGIVADEDADDIAQAIDKKAPTKKDRTPELRSQLTKEMASLTDEQADDFWKRCKSRNLDPAKATEEELELMINGIRTSIKGGK